MVVSIRAKSMLNYAHLTTSKYKTSSPCLPNIPLRLIDAVTEGGHQGQRQVYVLVLEC